MLICDAMEIHALGGPSDPFGFSLSQKTELVSKLKDDALVKVTIEFSSELTPTSPDRLRYYNVLFRKYVGEIW